MKVGIIGLPASGKTTLFNVLTRSSAQTGSFGARSREENLGVINVPDPRFHRLIEMYRPKKEAPAFIEFVDALGGLETGSARSGVGQDFFAAIRSAETLVNVVRCFSNEAVPHPSGSVDPVRDARAIVSELILGDMVLVERRLERLEKQLQVNRAKMTGDQISQIELLKRLRDTLEAEVPARKAELKPDEWLKLRELEFLSAKPILMVANIDEASIGGESGEQVSALHDYCRENEFPVIDLCAEAEMQVTQLGPEEEAEFLAAYGIEESGRDRLIRLAYEQLGLISFFTVGEDEVKAWTIRRGQTAVEAAGRIHTDIARGFIRAEVVSYDHLTEDGSLAAAKEKGHWRLEGKDYIVQDGDILNIRFNVSK
ncbi:MAG: redox-regulated ATPase YchF [Armatimonadetes bacterium]|nr:redox-regulated ATPase YchF [Armatimonadota bacterium]